MPLLHVGSSLVQGGGDLHVLHDLALRGPESQNTQPYRLN